MKKLLLLLAGTLAIAGATPAVSQSEPTATFTVNITATGFSPQTVVARANDTITWRNTDTEQHQVVSDTGAFPSSPVLDAGESYSYRFGEPSAYSYHDGRKPSSTGTIHVRGTGNSVTIGLSRIFLVYRNPVTVTGTVANGRPGESVTVTITRYGGVQETRTLTTQADGVWEFTDRPPIRTEYKASWRGGLSNQAPFVNVRPLVIFRILSHRAGRFYVKVAARRSYGGRTVFLQRRTSSGGWVSLKRARLNARGEARFTARVPRGRTPARMWVNKAPGYIVGFSVTKTVRR
jgi:plastocyanin